MEIKTWICRKCDENDSTACIINATSLDKNDAEFVPSKCPYGILEPKFNERSTDTPPQLIQGYTAEQWQEIIDGGYLCEFGHDYNWFSETGYLSENVDGIFICNPAGSDNINLVKYPFCRPAQLKGVMRPIFVEPVDKEAFCVFLDGDGRAIISGMARWRLYKDGGFHRHEKAAKYIEV